MKIDDRSLTVGDLTILPDDNLEQLKAQFALYEGFKVDGTCVSARIEDTGDRLVVQAYKTSSQRLFVLMSILLENESDGWQSWTVKIEKDRKRLQDKFLRKHGVKQRKTSWGYINNHYDPKGGFSAIAVNYT